MPPHRRYSKREKLTAVVAAEMTSQEAASEALGIPRTTIHNWMDDPEMVELRQNARQALAEEMAIVARLATRKLGEAIRRDRLEPRDLILAAGMATDKSQLLSGQATSRTETRELTDTLDDHERARLRELIDQALSEAPEPAPPGAGIAPT